MLTERTYEWQNCCYYCDFGSDYYVYYAFQLPIKISKYLQQGLVLDDPHFRRIHFRRIFFHGRFSHFRRIFHTLDESQKHGLLHIFSLTLDEFTLDDLF